MPDVESAELKKMLDFAGNNSILEFNAQDFERFALNNACDTEKSAFIMTVRVVTRDSVLCASNAINRRIPYRIK